MIYQKQLLNLSSHKIFHRIIQAGRHLKMSLCPNLLLKTGKILNSKFQIQVALGFDQAGLQTLLSALNGAPSLLFQMFLSEYTEVYAIDFDCFMKQAS